VEEGAETETTGQVTTDVTTELRRLAAAFRGSEEFTRQELQDALALKNAEHFRKAYLLPALASGMVEMTLPDMPRSSKQRYRLTADASQWLAKQREGN
jgi:ATP-dependent DNA helicase RecG